MSGLLRVLHSFAWEVSVCFPISYSYRNLFLFSHRHHFNSAELSSFYIKIVCNIQLHTATKLMNVVLVTDVVSEVVVIVITLVTVIAADGLAVEALVRETVVAAAVAPALVTVIHAKAFRISCWLFKNNITIYFLSFTAPPSEKQHVWV